MYNSANNAIQNMIIMYHDYKWNEIFIVFKGNYILNITVSAASQCYWDESMLLKCEANAIEVWANAIEVWANAIESWAHAIKIPFQHTKIRKHCFGNW